MADRTPVLLAAGGASWEAAALARLGSDGVVVVKRCVDLHDLLASAATGLAEVAVVSGDLAGLDADAVVQLLRHDVRCVAVGGEQAALARLGVVEVLAEGEVDALPQRVRSVRTEDLVLDPEPQVADGPLASGMGRLVAVRGPAGAPGRTTVAIGLAAEHARRGLTTVLVGR